jgi:hypothetical protein
MDVWLCFALGRQQFFVLDFEIGMNNNRQFRRKGFTLVELMGAVVISMAIILMLYKVFDKVQSVFVVSQNRARAMEQGRIGMDMLVRDFQALSAAALNTPDGPVENIVWEGAVAKVHSVSPFSGMKAKSQDLFGHHCWFFTNDEDWRYVDYKFGSRENYKRTNPASPVGALWVYRSRVVPRAGLIAEREDHQILQAVDPETGELDEPAGYARMIDGVVSFRVRAASPAILYTGPLVPSHVEVELAVVDEKLVAEMEQGIGQRMEGETDQAIYNEKVKFLNENLDRVYFYKQLIRIQRRGL